MGAQDTSGGWLVWLLTMFLLVLIVASFYYGGSTLGLPMIIGALIGGAAVLSRYART
jgi:hypothetical protein